MRSAAEIMLRMDDEIKEQAAQLAGATGLSFNQYVIRLIQADLASTTEDERESLARTRTRKVHVATETKVEYTVPKKNKNAA